MDPLLNSSPGFNQLGTQRIFSLGSYIVSKATNPYIFFASIIIQYSKEEKKIVKREQKQTKHPRCF